MQCGVACLAMICRHFGMAYSLEQLSALCHPTTEGVSLKAISDAARELGMETVSARVPESQLTSTQEAGSIFINEVKNIIITVLAATAVILNS